jgi:hypothetical protein
MMRHEAVPVGLVIVWANCPSGVSAAREKAGFVHSIGLQPRKYVRKQL